MMQPASASSSSAIWQGVATPGTQPASEGQVQPAQSARAEAAQPRQILATVDGVDIVRDVHLLPGTRGHYDRAVVRCPAHSGSGVLCTKTRVFGPRTTSRLGQQEPVAFLASWVCAASLFSDRAAHMRFVPKGAAVGEALEKLRKEGLEG